MNKISKLIFSIAACETTGLIATPFTIAAVPTWYASLNKPSFSPPNWIFGPIWIVLYLMLGIAAYFIWSKGTKKKNVKEALIIFIIQLVLNFLWSILFFGFHSSILGLLDIVLLLLAIVKTISKFYKISSRAAFLLIPYLLWVIFASILNLTIVLLN